MQRIGVFITPHGLGHATRATAVLEALQRLCPGLAIDIFTTVEEQIFRESLRRVTMHRILPDIGLIQNNALHSDLAATAQALNRLLPFPPEQLRGLAAKVRGCRFLLCDIAPLGILVAEEAGLPSVLVENFTWDWIYRPYLGQCPELDPPTAILAEIYSRATLHIQCEPVCNPLAGAVTCPPIYRRCRSTPEQSRRRLAVKQRRIVLVTLGGIDFQLPHWRNMNRFNDCCFVLAGQQERRQISENCLALSRHCGIYHPDLIAAADLVVCKSGYSTLAECLQSGTRTACIARQDFAESAVLAHFVRGRLGGTILDEQEFLSGSWFDRLEELLEGPLPSQAGENGADRVAQLLLPLLGN